MTKLIYIGGYGRSGSTLIEYLLTFHPEVVACGEVERRVHRGVRRNICTCGRRVQDCPVWTPFQNEVAWSHEQLALALLDHVSERYSVMIDSSKTAWGSTFNPFRLRRKLGSDFLLLHIVRDPRGVTWSALKTRRRPKKDRRDTPAVATLRAALGWVTANLACEMFATRYPENYVRMRYEDLVRKPHETIEHIFQRVALPPLIEDNLAHDNRHQLYGNSMRFKPLSISDIREDVAWKKGMPKRISQLVNSLCWPLLKRYQY